MQQQRHHTPVTLRTIVAAVCTLTLVNKMAIASASGQELVSWDTLTNCGLGGSTQEIGKITVHDGRCDTNGRCSCPLKATFSFQLDVTPLRSCLKPYLQLHMKDVLVSKKSLCDMRPELCNMQAGQPLKIDGFDDIDCKMASFVNQEIYGVISISCEDESPSVQFVCFHINSFTIKEAESGNACI